MQKLLIIEDDIWIAHSLKLYLENSNFDVTLYHTWDKAVEKILWNSYDIIILDVNLPVLDWVDICKKVRETNTTPILMLTARTSEVDRITGLENGADDYMSKPFSPRELLARINNIVRRNTQNTLVSEDKNSNISTIGRIIIDKKRRIITVWWKDVWFTKNEYDIFIKILENQGWVVSRSSLMTQVIGYDNYMYDRTLDTHIKNIRKKIENKSLILTVRWEWYRLNV